MLLLVRGAGRAVWVGRHITLTVLDRTPEGLWHVRIDLEAKDAVSGPGVPMHEHVEAQFNIEREPATPEFKAVRFYGMRAGDTVHVGRGVRFRLMGEDDGGARIEVEAPRHMAVSRDDFTRAEHDAWQLEREAGRSRR